jgi:Ca2+-binding EF-hand superfamily protein
MKKYKDNTLHYETEIKKAFEKYESDGGGVVEAENLKNITQVLNTKKNNPFIYNTIKSLTNKKLQDNSDNISSKEYISYIDKQLDDTQSKEGLQNIYNVLCDPNDENISWTKFPTLAKQLGDKNMSNKLMKLIEQAKLSSKDLNFDEFCEIMNEDDNNDSEDYYNKKSYKEKKIKQEIKEESEEIGTISSGKYDEIKNEDKKMGEEEGEKSKRYHRRYRDSKNKPDNNENGNVFNKVHSKYRKKH